MPKIRDKNVFPIVATLVSSLVLVLWSVYFLVQRRFGSSIWPRLLPGFDATEAGVMGHVQGPVTGVIATCLGIMTVLAVAVLTVVYFRSRLRPALLERVFSLAASFAVTWILLEGMVTRSYEGTWYNIQTMMTHPTTVPVFGQRLLLVWPAMLLKRLMPDLPYLHAFLAVQALALAIAVLVTGEWSALFIGKRLKSLGQILLAVFLLPTFTYYTAHDVGVVIINTLCLLFLYQRRYWPFGLVFCLGILNHPNVLLMAPTAAAAMWTREKRSTIAWLVSLSCTAYLIVRIVLNIELPLPRSVDLRLWWNMRALAELSPLLILGQLSLLPWYVCGLAALPKADAFLKAAAVLLPIQYLVFGFYGQLYEVRMFDGFIPVLIGIFLCWLRDRLPVVSNPAVLTPEPAGTPLSV
jgi:hypothetical protein